jgi:hypothetical protein
MNSATAATEAASAAPPPQARQPLRRTWRRGPLRRRLGGNGSSHGGAEAGRRQRRGLPAHHVAQQLPALLAAGQFGVVLHPAQQEARFIGAQLAIDQRRQLLAMALVQRCPAGD